MPGRRLHGGDCVLEMRELQNLNRRCALICLNTSGNLFHPLALHRRDGKYRSPIQNSFYLERFSLIATVLSFSSAHPPYLLNETSTCVVRIPAI